jgi:hypothetical protein
MPDPDGNPDEDQTLNDWIEEENLGETTDDRPDQDDDQREEEIEPDDGIVPETDVEPDVDPDEGQSID